MFAPSSDEKPPSVKDGGFLFFSGSALPADFAGSLGAVLAAFRPFFVRQMLLLRAFGR